MHSQPEEEEAGSNVIREQSVQEKPEEEKGSSVNFDMLVRHEGMVCIGFFHPDDLTVCATNETIFEPFRDNVHGILMAGREVYLFR